MNTKNYLNNISILAFAFVAIVVIVNLFTTNNYGRSNREVVELVTSADPILTYHQLVAIARGHTGDYLLVDLRDEQSYQEGHLPAAINIPFANILESSSLRTLKRSNQTLVLYGDKESMAHTARVLLLSKGFEENVKVLGGNFETAMKHAIEDFKPSFANYREEKARFDFVRFMGGVAPPAQRQQPAGVIPAVRQETISAQGGC